MSCFWRSSREWSLNPNVILAGLSLAEGQILVNCKSKKKYLLWTNKVDLVLIVAFLEFLK